MGTEVRARLGRLPCLGCEHPAGVMVVQNAHGTLSMACDECGLLVHAKKGERAHADLLAKLGKNGPAPDDATPPAPAPPPPKPRASSVFNLADL